MSDEEQKFTIDIVWQNITPELQEELIQFWMANGALPNRQAGEQRAHQVCWVARNPAGELIGISTIYKVYNQILENNFWYMRAFVAEGYRDLDIGREFTWGITRYFEERFIEGHDPDVIGMFMEVENRFFQQHRREAIYNDERWGFTGNGYVYIGKDARGYHLRVYYFQGACI